MTLEDKVDKIYRCLVTDPLDKNSEGLVDGFKRLDRENKEIKFELARKANKWDWSKILKLGIKVGTKAGGM